MEINLSRDSIVDQRTGTVETPSEYLSNLREIEVNIARADEEIAALKGDLKNVKARREKLVAQLRGSVRDGQVLPLLELDDAPANDAPTDDDGFDIKS